MQEGTLPEASKEVDSLEALFLPANLGQQYHIFYQQGKRLAQNILRDTTSENFSLWQIGCHFRESNSAFERWFLQRSLGETAFIKAFAGILLWLLHFSNFKPLRLLAAKLSFYRGIVAGLEAVEAFRYYVKSEANLKPANTLPDITIFLCTRDRPDYLRDCLKAVLANNYPALELIVADQSDSADSEQVVQEFASDPRLKYVRLELRGRSRVLNHLLPQVTSSVIGFLDDDCRPAPDWLYSIGSIFMDRQEVGLLVGQVLAEEYDKSTGHIPVFEINQTRFCGLQRLQMPGGCGMGANMAARREVFREVSPFDEWLGPGSVLGGSDDFDFCYRAWKAGYLLLQSPRPIVWHDGFRSGAGLTALVKGYRVSGSAACMKYVRAREWAGVRLLFAMLGQSFGYIFQQLKYRRRPLGLRGLVATLEGVWRGLRLPLDRTKGVFRPASPPQPRI